MSGEIRVSSALKFGLRLASRIHVPVDLVHVVINDGCKDSPLEATGDHLITNIVIYWTEFWRRRAPSLM